MLVLTCETQKTTVHYKRGIMRTRSKLALIGLGVTLLMALAISSASAGKFSLSNQNIRITFRSLEFVVEGLGTDRCDVTLEGSFHSRTFTKTPELLIGYLTRASTAGCTLTTAILSLPWHVRYTGFNGTLPDITSIIARIARAPFSAGALGFVCLTESSIELRSTREGSGGITGVDVAAQAVSVRSGGGFGCPASTGSIRSAFTGGVFLLGTSNRITVSLI
ncbi:MAG TPA: hypothetical protein VGO48_00585 [Conexibacter sp.]|jgi:hypothetical protein|nr:hypothetical protein [Conexibacter sp.]